jgi:hypothetical protein
MSDFRLKVKDGRTFIYLTRWNMRIGELYSSVSPAEAQKAIDSLTIKKPQRKSAHRADRGKS